VRGNSRSDLRSKLRNDLGHDLRGVKNFSRLSMVVRFIVRDRFMVNATKDLIPSSLGSLESHKVPDHVSFQVIGYLGVGVADDLRDII
jgi:hypothetical protein